MEVFSNLWKLSLQGSPLKQKNAVCVSTIGKNGFPNSRFVDLKEADECGLVFCSSLESPKARDIAANAKTAMTIWWDHIGIQIRFQGLCSRISEEEATRHWESRSREAQLATLGFQQSQPIQALALLPSRLEAARLEFVGRKIERPASWGGYRLAPSFVEILEFKQDRLHQRTWYSQEVTGWKVEFLQP
jgi:pyridoxamine 5'-phosphate oxidase